MNRNSVARTLGVRRVYLAGVMSIVAACGGDATGARPVARVDVSPAAPSMWAGDTLRLSAVPRDVDGQPLQRAVAWTSSAHAVATVDAQGLVTAHGPGTAMLSALAEGRQGSVTITVSAFDLLFNHDAGTSSELFLLETDGTPRRLLAPGTYAMDAAPSPDGSRIAFVAWSDEGASDVWVVNRDGTGPQRLTSSTELDDQPAWSPDGTRIAWRSLASEQQGDVWVMKADGTEKRRLTIDPSPATVNDVRPAWSPDGSRIAYGSSWNGNLDIWTMRASDGGDPRRLTTGEASDADPAWSPDGSTIVFRRLRSGDSDLAIVSATGGAVTEFPRARYQRAPAWSPDGRTIVFEEDAAPSDVAQLFAMKPDGTGIRPLTTAPGGGMNPAFIRRSAP
jgi:dipeptidyl aminopeptidase/acylaminoacyl peptidase